ncbi:MAG: hypothetical protein LBG58_13895 [Planctomycetaceae bacterium]|jgi:hypothetical protein|nr:hypothetical protein [Planctomycetaceae bacterium]
MKKLIFLLFYCLFIIFTCNNACLAVESEKEIEIKDVIVSSLSSANLLKFDQFRCVYHIKFGYVSSVDEALQKGVTDLLGEYHAVWNKSGKTELLDIRDVTSESNKMIINRYREYNLMFDYCFLTDGKMSMLFNYEVGQGNLASTQHIERPDTDLPLTPDSYIYIQSILEYLTDSFLIEKVKILKTRNLQINKINVNLKQEQDTILISAESDPVNDLFARIFLVDGNCGYLPKKFIFRRGMSARYIFILDYFRFGDNKFFPKKVLEVQADEKQVSNDRYEIRTDRFRVREFEVSVFDPDSELKSSDFEIVLPCSVWIFDGKNLEDSQGYTLRENTKLSINDLDTFYRLVLDSDKKQIAPSLFSQFFSGLGLRFFLIIFGIFCILLGYFLNRRYKNS